MATDDAAPIGIALIGSGIFAKERHLPAILQTPTLSLKAVYSRTLASAAALCEPLAQKVDWYSEESRADGRGYDELLQNPNIKAVVIALPITVQPDFIRKALAAGKHVLSEKPIAKDVATAAQLLAEYRSTVEPSRGTWSIAENWRFLDAHGYAAEEVRKLGRVLGFRARVHSMVKPGGKYIETAWRKVPAYQGGFLLDGGIHYVAAMRMFLGEANDFARVSAFTHQLQEHLPPTDTVNAVIETRTGISGTLAIGFGSTFKGSGYTIACERGVVTVVRDKVTVEQDGNEQEKLFLDETLSGVARECQAWGDGLVSGLQDPRLTPEEALKDLVALEAMLKSGEQRGMPIDLDP